MASGDLMLSIQSTVTNSGTDDTMDLGTSALQFKDLYIDGLAYMDGFGEDLDFGDFDVHSVDGLYGVDDNVYVDLGTDGRIIISADGTGTPYSTPDIDITGTSYFDADTGFVGGGKIYLRDAGVFLTSNDDGVIDLDSDTRIDFNINTTAQINLTDGKFAPTTDNDIDLGDSTHELKDVYIDGILYTDAIQDHGLTATRVVFAGTDGLLSDDAEMTFVTDTLTVTKIGQTTFTAFPLTPSAAPDADYEVANKKYVDDNAGGLGQFSSIFVYRSTNQAITSGSPQKCQLDGESWDILNEYDNATNYRFTTTIAGKYLIGFTAGLSTMADGNTVYAYIYKNNAQAQTTNVKPGSADSIVVEVVVELSLAVNDYIEFWVEHNYGSNRNLIGAIEYTYAFIQRLV